MTTPFISCHCVTYGRVPWLEESIECFLRQDYAGRKELVIFNSLAEQDLVFEHPEVRIINAKIRPGTLGACRNACIEACQGDMVLVWDDDDIYLPHHLSNYGSRLDGLMWLTFDKMFSGHGHEIRGFGGGGTRCLGFRMEAWKAIGGYDHRNCGEDIEFKGRVERTGAGQNFQLKPEEVSLIYGWGNPQVAGVGVYHLSGQGNDRPGQKSGHERVGEYVAEQIKNGVVPTGRIQLRPAWRYDYIRRVGDHLAALEVAA